MPISETTDAPLKTREEIEAQIASLQVELARWQARAEAAILRQDWQCMAANNCTRCYERIDALKWVLYGAPFSTLIER